MYNFSSITDDFCDQHRQIIQDGLSEGLALFDEHCRGHEISLQKLAAFFEAFLAYQQELTGNNFLKQPDDFYTKQNRLYEEIYSPDNNFSDEIKLFLEFMLGLCRFCLSLVLRFSQYIYEDVLKIEAPSCDEVICQCPHCSEGNSFWQLLHNISILGKQETTELIKQTSNFEALDFWSNAETFFKTYPALKQLAKYIVSMQHIPEEKKFLGLAQTLHFGGFAGSGVLIREYTQLKPLLDHIIGYHNKECGGFNSRLSVILAQLNASKDYTNTISADLLSHYPANNLTLLDVGSGPSFAGIASIIDSLYKQDKTVKLTASDVDTNSIASLKEMQKKDNRLVDVRYFDLNFVDQVPDSLVIENNFDAIMANLVLHQLGPQEILNAIKFFVRIVKPGGYILNNDVGPGSYYQSLLVPANAVDREGSVKPWSQFNFKATSVFFSENHLKIAYPKRSVAQSFPGLQQQLYMFVAYNIIVIPEDQLDELTLLWASENYSEADSLISKFTCKLSCKHFSRKTIGNH